MNKYISIILLLLCTTTYGTPYTETEAYFVTKLINKSLCRTNKPYPYKIRTISKDVFIITKGKHSISSTESKLPYLLRGECNKEYHSLQMRHMLSQYVESNMSTSYIKIDMWDDYSKHLNSNTGDTYLNSNTGDTKEYNRFIYNAHSIILQDRLNNKVMRVYKHSMQKIILNTIKSKLNSIDVAAEYKRVSSLTEDEFNKRLYKCKNGLSFNYAQCKVLIKYKR